MTCFFVGGSQRSGTTLLNKFLCQDTSCNPKIAEASYLRELMTTYQNATVDFEHDTSSYFQSRDSLKNFHSNIINLFLNQTLRNYAPAENLVLKEPHLTQYFPQLFELVPDCRFILIARDPRDIISSMIQVGEKMATQNQPHFFQQRDMQAMSQHVMSFYAPNLNHTDPAFQHNLLVIRYEDLIQHTEDIRQRLRQFTGLPLDFPIDQNPNERALAEKDASKPRYRPWLTDNNARGINNSSIGNYRQVLRSDEILQIEKLMPEFFKLFQYPLSSN